jgi:hypothetical protein
MEDEAPTSEAIDPDGVRVVLKDAIWSEKIVRDHQEIEAYPE